MNKRILPLITITFWLGILVFFGDQWWKSRSIIDPYTNYYAWMRKEQPWAIPKFSSNSKPPSWYFDLNEPIGYAELRKDENGDEVCIKILDPQDTAFSIWYCDPYWAYQMGLYVSGDSLNFINLKK